ncbi:MAG: redoxin domain-containing protein [Alphaproteobacteria bacterium]|nr:redoxin domain-containing protein [Alphaproteobacteria bacterium]
MRILAALVIAAVIAFGAARAGVFDLGGPALAAPSIGAPAPAIATTDSKGEAVDLTALAGKTVILEWTNDQCPYVQKHYKSGNIPHMQMDAATDGIVWISIISSAPGKQGHVTPEEVEALKRDRDSWPAHVVLDETGEIGRAYGAKTTPHMFVIDPAGALVYAGAIDDKRSTDVDDVPGATNYVRQALAEMKAGAPVSVAETTPYGCSVKYD